MTFSSRVLVLAVSVKPCGLAQPMHPRSFVFTDDLRSNWAEPGLTAWTWTLAEFLQKLPQLHRMYSASMVPFASGLYPNTLEKLPSPSNSTSCRPEVRCSETHADRMILSLTASSQASLNLLTFSHCISRYVEHMQNDVALGFST